MKIPSFSNPNEIQANHLLSFLVEMQQEAPSPEKQRAVIYVRKSRVLKDSEHYSPEIQEQECREHAKKLGLEVVAVIEDLDKSGKNSKRPGLQKILQMIKSRQVDFVLSQYIDRNYRNGLSLLNSMKKHRNTEQRCFRYTRTLTHALLGDGLCCLSWP